MRSSSLLAAAALVMVLSGCAATVAPSAPRSSEPTPTATAEPQSNIALIVDDPAAYAAVGAAVLDGADWEGVHFVSPSRNEGCAILGPGANEPGLWGCALAAQEWSFPSSDPADFCYDAQVPCGFGIEVTGSEAPHPRYRGDPGFPAAVAIFDTDATQTPITTLEYGHSVSYGDVTCVSAESGVTCSNAASGHGFMVSTTAYELH